MYPIPVNYPNYYDPKVFYPYPYPYVHQERMQQPIDPTVNYSAALENINRQSDQGGKPYVVNIKHAATNNHAFRRVIWTGPHLQVTLMRLMPSEDIGAEIHPETDQFLRIEGGHGTVQMGDGPNQYEFQRTVQENDAIFVPAGKWHNLTNTGPFPLVLYSIYAPPEHAKGTLHQTKQEAMEQHNEGH
jgi:mannose-6-phosphate isomerase-like protein (cupin superfamily)